MKPYPVADLATIVQELGKEDNVVVAGRVTAACDLTPKVGQECLLLVSREDYYLCPKAVNGLTRPWCVTRFSRLSRSTSASGAGGRAVTEAERIVSAVRIMVGVNFMVAKNVIYA